jgi:hypothetical protein
MGGIVLARFFYRPQDPSHHVVQGRVDPRQKEFTERDPIDIGNEVHVAVPY